MYTQKVTKGNPHRVAANGDHIEYLGCLIDKRRIVTSGERMPLETPDIRRAAHLAHVIMDDHTSGMGCVDNQENIAYRTARLLAVQPGYAFLTAQLSIMFDILENRALKEIGEDKLQMHGSSKTEAASLIANMKNAYLRIPGKDFSPAFQGEEEKLMDSKVYAKGNAVKCYAGG